MSANQAVEDWVAEDRVAGEGLVAPDGRVGCRVAPEGRVAANDDRVTSDPGRSLLPRRPPGHLRSSLRRLSR